MKTSEKGLLKGLKILITGGSGFIGSVLVPKLLSLGAEVTVLDNFMFKQNSLAFCFKNINFEVINGDSRDITLLDSICKKFDIFIPLAAYVGMPLCEKNFEEAQSVNTIAIKSLVSKLSNYQKIIIPNTNSGYGIGEKNKFCDESSPLRPVSLYGKTKVEAEKIVMNHPNSSSLRLATVFGVSPRMRTDLLVNDFVLRAYKDRYIVLFEANFRRNFIHIDDVADTFIYLILNWEKIKNNIFNVGLSDANINKIQLCEEISKQIKDFIYLKSEIGQDIDKRDYIVSNEKLEKTGWKAKKSLSDGISELIKFYSTISTNQFGNV